MSDIFKPVATRTSKNAVQNSTSYVANEGGAIPLAEGITHPTQPSADGECVKIERRRFKAARSAALGSTRSRALAPAVHALSEQTMSDIFKPVTTTTSIQNSTSYAANEGGAIPLAEATHPTQPLADGECVKAVRRRFKAARSAALGSTRLAEASHSASTERSQNLAHTGNQGSPVATSADDLYNQPGDHECLLEPAAVTLENVFSNNPAKQGEVPSADSLPPLVALLSASTPAREQKKAAQSLADLVAENRENQNTVASAGAIPPLVALLSARTSADVQCKAACALGNLVCDNPENQSIAASAGAIPVLVALLSAGTSVFVQCKAACALGYLVLKNPDNQGIAASAGAFPLLVALLSAGTSADVQVYAACALGYLVFDNPGNQSIAASAGAVPLLVALLSGGTSEDVRSEQHALFTP